MQIFTPTEAEMIPNNHYGNPCQFAPFISINSHIETIKVQLDDDTTFCNIDDQICIDLDNKEHDMTVTIQNDHIVDCRNDMVVNGQHAENNIIENENHPLNDDNSEVWVWNLLKIFQLVLLTRMRLIS